MKSDKNKTIDLTIEEGRDYLARCMKQEELLAKAGESQAGTVQIRETLRGQFITGDAFEILPALPAGFADLLVVDPPYNIRKDYAEGAFQPMSAEEYQNFTRRWLQLTIPLLKPDGSVYVCSDWKSSMIIGPILEEFLIVRNRITWQREKGRGAAANWKNGLEDIWFATVSDEYHFDVDAVRQRRRVLAPYREGRAPKDWEETAQGRFRDTCPSNFWDDISIPFWSMAENTAHPAQKPEKLIAKLILASSSPGDLILDPFAGSGTTAVTAVKLGRTFTCIERSEQYCVWAQKRLEMAAGDPSIQGYSDGVFWERNTREWQKHRKK